jgi:hypothetical protein
LKEDTITTAAVAGGAQLATATMLLEAAVTLDHR